MKTTLLAFVFALLSSPSFALIGVGDPVPNLCWKNDQEKDVCVEDFKGNVRFLNYATGWCPDCKKEIQELVPKVKTYEKKPVVFLNLMAAGWKSGSVPDATFLKEWKEKYMVPFPVLASPKDAGKMFYDPPYAIPNFVVVDKEGKLAFKSMEATLDEALVEVDKLL